MEMHEIVFHGGILARGFWLYVWRVQDGARVVLYVGRTGDSSSAFASSPFRRIGQHLDTRATAKANSLAKQLAARGIDPERCTFRMIALGPLFPEQADKASHDVHRDRVAALERAVADHLRGAGHDVMGSHGRARPCDTSLLANVCAVLTAKLSPVGVYEHGEAQRDGASGVASRELRARTRQAHGVPRSSRR